MKTTNEILNKALELAKEGKALLFIGSGYSREAKNIKGNNLCSSTELSNKIARLMGLDNDNQMGLSRTATLYLEGYKGNYKTKAQTLVKLIQDNFLCSSVTDNQLQIMKFPWMRIYTTNYDNVAELASEQVGFVRQTVLPNDSITDVYKSKSSIIHTNGYVRCITADSFRDVFKLTSVSYESDSFSKSEIKQAMHHDLLEARAIILIGLSLEYDLDISRLLIETDTKEKTHFIFEHKDDLSQLEQMQVKSFKNKGTVHYIGIDGLCDFMSTLENIDIKDDLVYRSFIPRYNLPLPYVKEDVSAIWSVIYGGEINEALLSSHLDDNKYLFSRSVLYEMEKAILNNDGFIYILTGRLGNGKSVLIEQLSCKLSNIGQIYTLDSVYDDVREELVQLLMKNEKVFLFIDDYTQHLEILKQIAEIIEDDKENLKIILTSRTGNNLVSQYEILDYFHIKINDISWHSLDQIDNKEFLEIKKYYSRIGLTNKKLNYIFTKNAKKQGDFSKVIIPLFDKNSKIGNKSLDEIKEVFNTNKYRELLLVVIINNLIQLKLDIDRILIILNQTDMKHILNHDYKMKEILFNNNGYKLFNSAPYSKFIQKNLFSKKEVINVLQKLFDNYHRLGIVPTGNKWSNEKDYRKHLLSLSNLRVLLSEMAADVNIKETIIGYFENLIDNEYCKDNIFYWLQYAMASMDNNDYDKAEMHLEKSYEIASERSGFNTYQLDTQYARFLLEKNMFSKVENPYDIICEVDNKLETALKSRETAELYIFRILRVYSKYIIQKKLDFCPSDVLKIDQK